MLKLLVFFIVIHIVKQTKRRNAQKERERIVEIEEMTKVKEISKKLLTKRGESGRILELSQRAANIRSKRVEKVFKEI